jgi:hypothetical protein
MLASRIDLAAEPVQNLLQHRLHLGKPGINSLAERSDVPLESVDLQVHLRRQLIQRINISGGAPNLPLGLRGCHPTMMTPTYELLSNTTCQHEPPPKLLIKRP